MSTSVPHQTAALLHISATLCSCPESHTGNVEAQMHSGSVKINSAGPAASPSQILDTWEQESMGRCPESTTAGQRGVWGTINRGVQSFMGAVRGVAQRFAVRWTGNSGASARDMAIPPTT